jgi:hypothetical protein
MVVYRYLAYSSARTGRSSLEPVQVTPFSDIHSRCNCPYIHIHAHHVFTGLPQLTIVCALADGAARAYSNVKPSQQGKLEYGVGTLAGELFQISQHLIRETCPPNCTTRMGITVVAGWQGKECRQDRPWRLQRHTAPQKGVFLGPRSPLSCTFLQHSGPPFLPLFRRASRIYSMPCSDS